MNLDSPAMIAFLAALLNTPSPTGYAVDAIALTRRAFESLNIPDLAIVETPKGALHLTWLGAHNDAPRGLTAHVDTLGLLVKAIKPNGRLQLSMIGHYPWNAIEGEGVTIRTFDDRRYRGTVQIVNPSTHVNLMLRTTERTADNMEVRIDARTTSPDETRALGIEVGDFVFLDARVETSEHGFIRSRHLDDKAGVAAIYGAIAALHHSRQRPLETTEILIANYEEVGHGGSPLAHTPLAELVAIDMGAIGDSQYSDEFSVSICIKDASGAYHHGLTTRLRQLAIEHNIPYRPDIYISYSSDGSAYWRAGGAGRVALIGPGVEASHSYERTHMEAITATANLIARYLVSDH